MSPRSGLRGVAGWLFGLSVTVLLISVWGRAVVADSDQLARSLSPLSSSVTVVDLLSEWVETELVDSGVDGELATKAVHAAFDTSALGTALETFVVEVVHAAASVDPDGASVDVGRLLEPAAFEISAAMTAAGVPVPEPEVAQVIEGLEPFMVRQPGAIAYVGPASPVAARLGTAALLALMVMLGTGGAAIAAAEDRLLETRRLLSRVALGALSYGMLLRIGSWILDPGGGRAPIGRSLAALAGSKWMVPIGISAAAGFFAALVWILRRAVRPGEGSRSPDGDPTPERERALSPTA